MLKAELVEELNNNCEHKESDESLRRDWDEDDFDDQLNPQRSYYSSHPRYCGLNNLCVSCAKIMSKYKNKYFYQNSD
jgi:hypothetical protein